LLEDHSENLDGQLQNSMVEKYKEVFNKRMNETENWPKQEVYRFKMNILLSFWASSSD